MPTPIPQDIEFKPEFLQRYQALLGSEFDRFIEYSSMYIRKAVRVNTLKISVQALVKRLEKHWRLTPVPWCPEGFWIEHRYEERFDIGNLPEHALGYLYVQDPASMIPPVVLAPEPGDVVLDLCAAPGSKTTQLGALMQNEGVLIANDVAASRLTPLGMNVQRCGLKNCVVTLRANKQFAQVFDKVLVDAPCSGTGTIRRSLRVARMWSPSLVRRMVHDQRGLLRRGYELLKPGGVLVYSTCTLEPEENEGVVSWLLTREPGASLEPISLAIKRQPAVSSWRGEVYDPRVKDCLRILPQDNDTEGFFVARIRKA
ncbi:RsmB/NOP family class I SAM-dependent RNA methyltransferase [Candidatus Woesearchaeota archaeon]|nr:MAG: RsmB/NOP family class I SAM-dependent RNA methyltransferase [Candidatus Woesearchaeota archaeon]